VRTAQLFVATPGASSYTFAEAAWTQSLPDWIASHVRAFGFFGGVTVRIVSPSRQIALQSPARCPAAYVYMCERRTTDNLKAGVTKACFHDPAINRTCGDMATHYDTALVRCPWTNGGQGLAAGAAAQTQGQSKGRGRGFAG